MRMLALSPLLAALLCAACDGSTSDSSGATAGKAGDGGSAGASGMGGAADCTSSDQCTMGRECDPTGKCVCPAGLSACGDACADLAKDPLNCGSCGNACGGLCVDKACDDPVGLAAGASSTCAVLSSGDVYCWGRNDVGQLGGVAGQLSDVPVKIPGLGKAKRVVVGKSIAFTHLCAVTQGAELWCWGSNLNGKLGIGEPDLMAVKPPTKVSGLAGVTAADLGRSDSFAMIGQKIYGWGANDMQELGYQGPDLITPQDTMLAADVLVAGTEHTCALQGTALSCWGRNDGGQVGAGNLTSPLPPTKINVHDLPVSDVACGDDFTCVRAGPMSMMYCWGSNAMGQLGLDGSQALSQPGAPVPLMSVDAIFVGSTHAAALKGGELYAWGRNDNGQVDSALMESVVTSPLKVQGLGVVKAVALGTQHSCVLEQQGDSSSRVVCWGGNFTGNTGTGSPPGDHVPPTVVKFQ